MYNIIGLLMIISMNGFACGIRNDMVTGLWLTALIIVTILLINTLDLNKHIQDF